jgi:hypothetical protein
VGIDNRLEPEQSEAWADVLLDEIPFFVDLAAGHRELRQRGSAGARPADHATASKELLDLGERP